MKYYSEKRHFIRRTPNSIGREDVEARIEKHEISETCYNVFTQEIFADSHPLKNSDGSISYSRTLNSNEYTETTFWVEE